jgi:GT2 family glycosyltransferase
VRHLSVLKAGITVVHWGSVEDTLECLASLAAITYPDVDITLVINGVEAADPRLESSACPNLHLVRLPDNVGYAAAANAGARDLFARGADAVLMLNNDTTVVPGVIEPLAAALERDPRAGIVGPVIVYADDPRRVWFAGGTLHPLLGLTRHNGLDADVDGCVRALGEGRPFAFANGCALMIRREVFERTGGLESRYFHYFDDLDVCEHARAIGYESIVVGSASVAHKVSSATGHRGTNRLTAAQAYFFTRNRFLFLRWNMRGARRAIALLAQVAVLLPYEVARHLLDRDVSAAFARVRGLFDGILGRSGRRARWARHG